MLAHDLLDAVRRRELGGRHGQRLGGHAGLLDEVLEPAGRQHPQHAGAVGADVEAVRDVARAERVLAGPELDDLVADRERDRALEDVEALVLVVVDVQRVPARAGVGVGTFYRHFPSLDD